jgi:PKD repeat protein
MKHKLVLFASVALFISTLTFAFGIRVENASGTVPLTVNFSCTPSGGQSPYTFSWVFGDGWTSTQQNPRHVYTTAGTFNAQVTVTSTDNQVQTCSQQITASWPPVQVSCTANLTAGTAPLTVNFTSTPTGGSGSYSYDWNWGDGTTHGTTQNPSHTYTTANTFTATVTVSSGGLNGTCSKTITVSAPVTLTITSFTANPTTIGSGESSNLQATIVSSAGYTPTWTLSFSGTGTVILSNSSGSGTTVNEWATGGALGNVQIHLHADDGHGNTDDAYASITVN